MFCYINHFIFSSSQCWCFPIICLLRLLSTLNHTHDVMCILLFQFFTNNYLGFQLPYVDRNGCICRIFKSCSVSHPDTSPLWRGLHLLFIFWVPFFFYIPYFFVLSITFSCYLLRWTPANVLFALLSYPRNIINKYCVCHTFLCVERVASMQLTHLLDSLTNGTGCSSQHD